MNPMEAVVRVLEDEGVKVAFGVPGAAILPLYDAMRHSSIRHLSVRHEEGGTHAADGWARVTGEPPSVVLLRVLLVEESRIWNIPGVFQGLQFGARFLCRVRIDIIDVKPDQ